MENEFQNSTLNKAIENNQVNESVIPKNTPYIPVEDMFLTSEYDAFIDTADVNAMQRLEEIKPMIAKYGINAMANMGVASPGLATDTYNPVKQQQDPLYQNTIEDSNNFIRLAMSGAFDEKPAPGREIVSPILGDMRKDNFIRYYSHPKFNELGFSPFADMETTYNANSTVYDDYTRMWGQYLSLAGVGLKSSYRAINDMMGNNYLAPDLKSADEFTDAMNIGNSSRGGTMAWTNNFLLNSAYTVGIIGSIAIEEVVLASLAGVQGFLNPAADALLATRTAQNVGRLKKGIQGFVKGFSKTVTNSFMLPRLASSTRDMYNTLKGVDKARDFWTMAGGGGKILGVFAPETVAAIKNLKTAQNGAQNLTNLAKMSNTFGGFYRDVRSLNYALAESKLEGGMVYNDMIRIGAGMKLKENDGSLVTPEQMSDVHDAADRAAFKTTLINAPIIYATNQLVLGTAFGGFNKSLAKVFNEQASGIAGKILKSGGKTVNPYTYAGEGIKGVFNSVIKAGVKGNTKNAAIAGIRYFSQNFGEGIQEISQEAISHGTKEYYTALLENPLLGGINLTNQSIKSAINAQFTAQGFDVFMSGFLMGGILKGPQKLFFEGIPAIYKIASDPQAYKEYNANKENYIKRVVQSYNDIHNSQVKDPYSIFDPKSFGFIIQNELANEVIGSNVSISMFNNVDAKDHAKFQQIHDVLSTGGAHFFKQQMKDFMKLSDAELAEAFPTNKKEIKSGKLRTRFQDMVNQIDRTEDKFNDFNDLYPNPFDRNIYNPKTQSRQYQQEALNELTHNHMRYLFMFTDDGFTRALERADSIYSTLAAEPLFEKMAASDITVLLSKETINKELVLLKQEIDILSDDKSQVGLVKEKAEKFKRLEILQSILNDPKNLTKDGSFDKRKAKALRKDFHNYVRFMAKTAGSFVNQEAIDNALIQIIDHNQLTSRAKVYDRTIEALLNPEKFNDVAERTSKSMKSIYDDIENKYKESLEKYITVVEQNQLLNQISAIESPNGNPIPDPDEVIMFGTTGDASFLKTFFNSSGVLTEAYDGETLRQINKLISIYNEISNSNKVNTKTEDAQSEETSEDVESFLTENNIDIALPAVDSIELNNILKKAYNKYLATQTVLSESSVKYEEWINTTEAQNYRLAFNTIKKIWIANDELINPNKKLSQEDIKNDIGLIDWLRSEEGRNNDLVAEILEQLNISLSTISGQIEALPAEGEIFKGNKNIVIIKIGSVVSLRETKVIDPSGKESSIYEIIDNKTGEKLSIDVLKSLDIISDEFGIFIDKVEAINAWKQTQNQMPNDGIFSFDGVDGLHYGAKVYKNGIEYTVISKPESVVSKNRLVLIPSDTINLSSEEKKEQKVYINLSEGEFKNFYNLQELDFKILPKTTSRVDYAEFITPYGHKNLNETDWSLAKERYYAILGVLSQEDLKSLEFVVEMDPQSGELGSQYVSPGKDPNPYIVRKKSKYIIGIRTNNPTVQEKIDALFLEGNKLYNIAPSDNPNNVFANLPNENYEFFGGTVEQNKMSREQLLQTIDIPKILQQQLTKEEILKIVKDNLTKNSLLVSEIDKLMAARNEDIAGAPLILTQDQLPNGLSFVPILGNVVYDNNSTRNLKELENQGSADELGNYLIYQLEKGKTDRNPIPLSNLQEGKEKEALISRVNQALIKQGIFENLSKGSDAYMAAVLISDGTYRLVNLKSNEFNSDLLTQIFTDLIDRAQSTQLKNPNGEDKQINTNFNDEKIKQKLHITGYPGINFKLTADIYGKVQLTIKKDDKYTDVVLSKSEVSDKKLSVNEKIDILIKRANETDALKTAISSPEAGNKVGLVLTTKNFKVSYSREVSIDELIEKTVTNVKPQVVGVSKIQLGADSAAIQMKSTSTQGVFTPTERFTDAEGKPINKNTKLRTGNTVAETLPISEEVESGILDLEQEQFDAYKADDFNKLPSEMLDHIANKIVRGEEFNDREKTVYSVKATNIEIKVVLLGGRPDTKADTKKADIERRRQEELKQNKKLRVQDMKTKVAEKWSTIKSESEELRNYIKNEFAEKHNLTQEQIDVLIEFVDMGEEDINSNPYVYFEDFEDRPDLIKKYNLREQTIKDSKTQWARLKYKFPNLTQKQILAIGSIEDISGYIARQQKGALLSEIEGESGLPNNMAELNAAKINAKYDAELAALGTDTKADIVVSPLTVLTNKRDNLKEELTKGKPVGQHRKILQNSEEYQTLLKQIKNFGNQANKIIKLLDSQDVQDINTFMGWAVENLPDFITIGDINTLGNNMKAGGVRVGAFALNLHDLAGKLNISGTLYTGAKSPFRYHEAFHGVFRMLLTDVEIKKYLAIARKEVRANLRAEGKSFEAELQRFKNSADTYSNMSPERLEQEYYEEYLADQFELFKENPRATKTDSAIKSLFTRILEWIKSLFNSYHKTELLTLFENIDAGKFKTSALVSNQFTNGLATGVTLEANALIPYEKVEDSNSQGYLFLNSALADPLIRSIAAMYLSRVSKITTFNTTRSEVLDGVIDNFYELYHPDSAINVDKTEEQKEILNSIIKSFDNYIDQIKNQVYNILNVIDGQILEEEYNTEYFEDTIGLRGADQWNTDASLIGGINSTPKQIRAYLATTVMEATDFFGNTELVEGEPLIIPVPFNEVYNGLLKSTKNIADPKKMLQNMYFFGQQNPSTGAVVKRILQDIGVTEETLLNDSPLPLQLKDPLLFQSITKTFENFRVDYLFTQRDLMGNILMYSAAERDDINSQVDRWAQAWNDAQYKIKVNEKTKNRTLKTLTELMSLLKETSPKSTVDATETAIKYSKLLFELTGIKLSTQYMLYSILYNRVESGNVFKTEIENEDGTVSKQLDIKQRALIQLHKNEETPLTSEVIREMHSIINNGDNIFDDGATGMNSRLVNIAKNNAPFDETIGLSVFKNPEGNFVYAHQKSTFHLYQVELLNDIEYLKKLENDDPYLYTNYLLNNPAFIQLSKDNRQKIIRVAGGSVGQINSTEEQINENISTVSSKSTYGNFTPQEFALNLLNTYTALVNSKSGKVQFVEYIDPITNEKRKTALAPSLIRVLEASNTGDMMYLPVMKAVKFAKEKSEDIILTDELIDVFIDSIYTEYKRIQREVNSNTATKEQIVGYNIEGIGENGEPLTTRAYNLHNSALLLTPQLKTELEEYARRNKVISLEEALSEQNITMDDFRSEVIEQLESQFTQFKNILQSLNIDTEISNKIKDGLIGTEVKSNDNLVTSNDLLNLTSNEEYNLKQIFFNDWANTHSINEIFLGDQAVTLKNGIDAIKRGKGQNATFISANSAITAPELGVYHTVDDISLVTLEEPVDNSANTGKKIDKADAQMWMTVKAFRYMYFGFGKLSKLQTKILDKIEQGEDILSSEIFGEEVKIVNTTVMNDNQIQTFIVKDKKIFDINGIEALQLNQNTKEKIFELAKKEKTTTLDGLVDQDDAMLNSKKLVYFDGKTYIKMSAFVLTKQLTSNKVVKEDGTITWVAKETTKPLHDLRIKLEDIESTKDTISIAAPLSALKMLKQNVKSLEDIAGSRRFDKNDYTTLSAKNMGLQVVTPSNKKESIDPAQIKTLVTSEQDDATKVPGMLKPNGKPMDLGYIRKEYNKAVSRRVEIKYKNKRNLIFTFDTAMNELKISKVKGKLTPNLIAFLRFAQEGLKASQSSSQLLDFFSTENGEQKYDLNNPNTIAKFEQLFLSYMSKGTLAEKQPGLSLTLVSDFGKKVYRRVYSIDKDGIPDRSEIIREKVWENLTDKPEIVEFDTLLGRKIPKEGIVVLDRLRSGVKEYDINGKFTGLRYMEMILPAHFKSIMDLVENGTMSMPEVISKMFAIRVPSQDNHSTINIKHVDFLPAYYGSSAMFAQELIEISGADFDIDKVIAQIKEFYVENNKFIEYGKGKTESNRYDEYLRYVSEKVQKKGTIYNEAYQLYIEDNQSARIQNSVTDAEQNSVTDAGLSENGLKALQMLGLPITLKQYSEYFKNHGEPYEAPMNNQILDYKYALMGNTHVTQDTFGNELPISYQPANLDVLNFNLNLLISESDVFKKRNEEDNADIDNMLGKINAFISNKGASIGAIVKPNVNLSLLTEYGIEIKGTSIKINGIKYNKFGVLREQLIDGTEGVRKQDIISALITMATDNAKERLVAKLGLNRSALGLVANLTALGVPLYTSLLLINNPSIQSIYNEALNKKEKTDPGVKSLIQEQLLLLKVKPEEFVNVTDSLLLELINNPIDGMSSNVSQSDKNKLASILNLVLDGIKIQDFTAKMSSVSNLTNGLGRSIAEVNKRKTDIDELLDPKAIMDLSPIYKSDTWQSKYVEIFNQIVEQILPEIFLSASVPFQSILNSTLKNVNENNLNFNEDVLPKISRDLLSYITIKAYQHNKLNNNSQSAATLNNNFIYPVDENQADNSIVKVINKLKQRDDMKNNYFLESFVNIINALDISNQSGLNLLNANTFISLNPLQKVDLQSAFSQIYGTASTKDDAMSIINYIMVKSGLQVEYGTLLDAISPFTLGNYLSQIATSNDALRNPKDSEKMKSVFGLTFNELKDEFINGYMQSNVNNSYLNTFEYNEFNSKIKLVRQKDKSTSFIVSLDYALSSKDYFRVQFTSSSGSTYYTTYMKKEQNEEGQFARYDEIPTYGSNQQWGGGFMFGERPTYKEVRKYVNDKNNVKSDEAEAIQSEGISNYDTQPTSEVKEGVSELFKENTELSEIGTEQQYSEYLDSVFPNSKVKDIVYHGTIFDFPSFSKKKLGKYTQAPSASQGFFFTNNRLVSDSYIKPERIAEQEWIHNANQEAVKRHGKLKDTKELDSKIEELKELLKPQNNIAGLTPNKPEYYNNSEYIVYKEKDNSKFGGYREDNEWKELKGGDNYRYFYDRNNNQYKWEKVETNKVENFTKLYYISKSKNNLKYDTKIVQKELDWLEYVKDLFEQDEEIPNLPIKFYWELKNGESYRNNELLNTYIINKYAEIGKASYRKPSPITKSVILNIEKPLTFDYEGEKYRNVSYYDKLKEAKKENKDGAILQNTYDSGFLKDDKYEANVLVVFEPEQIHILGSKQDVKAFKEFVTQPSTQLSTIKPGFVGKIVYATPGSGKTTLAESTNNIVDMDKLMMEEMTKRQPDFKQDENETIQDAIYRYVITYKDKSSVNSAVLDEAKKLAAQGKTVLTGTLAFIKDADIVLRMNPESLRAINKFKTLEKSKEFARKEKAAAANKGATETKAIEETLMDYSNPQSTVIPKEETERFLTDPTSNIEVTNAEIKINGVNIADVVEKEDDVIDVEEMTIVKTDEKTNDKTITYKPIGKETQTYTIRGNKIFNKNNVEVFKIDSVDKNKIFANLAIQEGRASVKSEIKSSIVKNNWTKDSPKENPNTAYIFTENINSIGSSRVGGGSAVIRNNSNAIGIVTKKYYVYTEDRNPKASIPQNLVSGIESFGTKQEANSEAKRILGNSPHSIDMIEAGLRTRTTRSVGEMDKYDIKVGDVIKQFGKSADGSTKNITTIVTAIHPKGTPGFLGTWNKEGWTQEGIEAIQRFKDGAAAIEFEIINNKWNQDFQDTEADFELFKKVNLEQFTKIDKYDNKIFPQGFASDLAKIPTKFAEWLQNELLTRYGLVTELNANKTGLISKSITQSSTSVSAGVEISSSAKGLAAALTNPTELAKSKGNLTASYPVEFRSKTYKDAEAAYQALKSTATKDDGPNSTYNLMVNIIKAKLEQHPRLVNEITKQGGSAWILSSTHQPTKQNSVWETGGKNWFIKSLNDAYLSTQQSTSVEESIDTFEQMSLFDDSSFEEIETDTNNNSAGIEQLMLALYPQNRSNDVLTNFWDSKVETNNELKQKLKEQKIVSLDNFIKQRNSGIYKSDEDFLESLGCL